MIKIDNKYQNLLFLILEYPRFPGVTAYSLSFTTYRETSVNGFLNEHGTSLTPFRHFEQSLLLDWFKGMNSVSMIESSSFCFSLHLAMSK